MGLFKPNVEKLAARGDAKGLVKALKNKDVGGAAAEALLKIGKTAVPALIEALKSNDADLGEAAAKALGRFGEAAVPALIMALKGEQGGILIINSIKSKHLFGAERISNINRALVEVGEAAVPALIEVMKDRGMSYLYDHPNIPNVWLGPGVMARLALGEIGDVAVPALSEALRDKDEWVRYEAAFALAKIGEAAVLTLKDALEDEDPSVRQLAARALEGEPRKRVNRILAQGFQGRLRYD